MEWGNKVQLHYEQADFEAGIPAQMGVCSPHYRMSDEKAGYSPGCLPMRIHAAGFSG